MGFVALKCPSCGASVQIEEDREFGFCSYCGTKVTQDKIIVEHRGSVSVSGLANERTLLDRAFLFLEDRDFINANIYFERLLDASPKCSKAYIGKLLCQLHLSKIEHLKGSRRPLNKYDFFLKAKRFATESELEEYQKLESIVLENLHKQQDTFKKQISDFETKISELEAKAEIEKKQHRKASILKVIWIVLIIVLSAGIVFSTWGTFMSFIHEDPPIAGLGIRFILILVPSVAGVIFAVIQLNKTRMRIVSFEKTKNKLSAFKRENVIIKAQYENWVKQTF